MYLTVSGHVKIFGFFLSAQSAKRCATYVVKIKHQHGAVSNFSLEGTRICLHQKTKPGMVAAVHR